MLNILYTTFYTIIYAMRVPAAAQFHGLQAHVFDDLASSVHRDRVADALVQQQLRVQAPEAQLVAHFIADAPAKALLIVTEPVEQRAEAGRVSIHKQPVLVVVGPHMRVRHQGLQGTSDAL